MKKNEELELKQYRKIKTLEKRKWAVEKQIPKKLVRRMRWFDDKYSFSAECFCPSCDRFFTFESEKGLLNYPSTDNIYCSTCGQNVDLILDYHCLEDIKRKYEYYVIVKENPDLKKEIDLVMDILTDAWKIAGKINQSNDSKIKNQEITLDVADKIIKLEKDSIAYAVQEFSKQMGQIENPTDFMIEILSNTIEQWEVEASCYLEKIRQNYEYYVIIKENPHLQKEINLIMNILVDAWKVSQPNNSKIKSQKIEIAPDIADEIIKVNKKSILHASEGFSEFVNSWGIEDIESCMVDVLYNTVEQLQPEIK